MKFNFLIFLLFIFISDHTFSQTTFFIKYKNSVPREEVNRKVADNRYSDKMSNRPLDFSSFRLNHFAKGLGKEDEVLGRIVKITFNESVSEDILSYLLNNDNEIDYIQQSVTYKVDNILNDSLVNQQWALSKIQAFDAWKVTTGNNKILLSIIDTGIDFEHPDLKNKIFLNVGEIGTDSFGFDKRFNGIDDDNNGFIDDYMGWDFVDRVGFPFDSAGGDYLNWDNNPIDENGHGTYIAGIAAAETGNNIGIAGAAPNIKILNLRAFDPGGFGEEDDVAAAILYAIKMGTKVINMSFGDNSFSLVLRDVIRYAYSQNVVLIASSGNSASSDPHYPSGYSEVICVGNSTEQDFVSPSSNWGSTIDLVAPGSGIITTAKDNSYAIISGTSASAPFVSASASLILSVHEFTNEEVKQIIKSTTDDIGEQGWDLRSGAGRLNMKNALTVIAPSEIKFFNPLMDFATNQNTIEIIASVLSPYFISYNLEVGRGINPTQWTNLIKDARNQFSKALIYSLDVSAFKDDVYTLRLVVFQSNGRTLEERVNFYIIRTNPELFLVGIGPIYYGDKSTIQAEIYTSQRSIVRMYYKIFGESEFNFITLDGFNTNNQFVKQLHYGFLPKEIALPSTLYEIYFEAENLAGLKTIFKDQENNNQNFIIRTDKLPEPIEFKLMPFSLPNAITLFPEPVNFLSDDENEVLVQLFYPSQNITFGNYKLEENQFVKTNSDSLINRYPQLYGDFNKNGLKDLITLNFTNAISIEQSQSNSFSFNKKDSSNKIFYPLLVDELANDGISYLISQNFSPDRYLLWRINQDLSTTLIDSTFYISKADTFGSNKTTKNIKVDDFNYDGVKEIWFLDDDGDLKSFLVNQNLSFIKADSFYTFGLTPPLDQDIFSIGDYDGDGIKDFAILYETNSISPGFLLVILTFAYDIPRILMQEVFLDQSAEYSSSFTFSKVYQSLKFVNTDGDNQDELVVNIFPYTYIFKRYDQENKIVFYTEGSNTKNVFMGDLNQNGVTEIGLRINNEFKFFEFSGSDRIIPPANVQGYSIDSNTIKITWISENQKFYIYRGITSENLVLIDSTFEKFYFDNQVEANKYYFYAVQAYDAARVEPLSKISKIIEVYSHQPAKLVNAINNNANTVIITFSEKIKNTVENLQSFYLANSGNPNSVSPSDQYSYLLTFSNPLREGTNTIYVSKLRDYYNSPVSDDSLTFNVNLIPEETEFFVSSFEIVNPYLIKINFNLAVDEQTATNVHNFSFNPHNVVTKVKIDNDDKRIIYLDLTNQKPVGSIGKEYILKIENVLSDIPSGNILIRSGAGSYIVLTGYANDLSDVYVYPNPVKIGESHNAVTFANLPQKARITIWDINGVKIKTLEEQDGNGGLTYDLLDETGKNISSGIYFFRVVMLDNQNNERQEKLGKFAVIK